MCVIDLESDSRSPGHMTLIPDFFLYGNSFYSFVILYKMYSTWNYDSNV
jgi:hypothetical protein